MAFSDEKEDPKLVAGDLHARGASPRNRRDRSQSALGLAVDEAVPTSMPHRKFR